MGNSRWFDIQYQRPGRSNGVLSVRSRPYPTGNEFGEGHPSYERVFEPQNDDCDNDNMVRNVITPEEARRGGWEGKYLLEIEARTIF